MQQQNARFGFGCYRISDNVPEHEEALRYALSLGIDVVDTSHNYTNGGSERLVGRVLKERSENAEHPQGANAKRPLVITKLAYADNDTLDTHFTESLMRLKTQFVDVLLLHNPEDYLQTQHQEGISIEEARAAFYERILAAFTWMEQQRTAGTIGAYGISSNTFAHDIDAPDHISLQECLKTAERCVQTNDSSGGGEHGFKYIQLPFNLVEHFVITSINQFEEESASGSKSGSGYGNEPTLSTLEVAQKNNIAVITNRPLNAIVGQDLIRLASHDIAPHASEASILESRIHQLEIVEHDVMQLVHSRVELNDRETAALQETFRIASALCQAWNKFEGLIHWRDVRRDYLEPRLRHAASYVSALTTEEIEHLTHYTSGVRSVLAGIDALYASEENDSLEELRATMADEFGLPLDTPLQHIALHAIRCTAGIDTVLVGMRTPEYVDDVLSSYSLPETTYHRSTWNRIAQHLARLST